MAAMTPLLTTGAALAVSAASNEQSTNQLKQTQALGKAQSEASAALKRTTIQQEAAADKADRKTALRKVVASRKANFGAQGVSSDGGSSEAVLLGLVRESEIDQAQEDSTAALKLAAIEQDLEQENAINILQRTQLQQNNAISLFEDLF